MANPNIRLSSDLAEKLVVLRFTPIPLARRNYGKYNFLASLDFSDFGLV
jgi:hypothetical protein